MKDHFFQFLLVFLRIAIAGVALSLLFEIDDGNWMVQGFWRDASLLMAFRTVGAMGLVLTILVHAWIPLTFAPYVLVGSTLGFFALFPSPVAAIIACVAGLLLLKPLKTRFQGESPNKARAIRGLKFGFLVLFILILGIFVLTEIPGLRSSMSASRFETVCRETQEQEACGRWALHLIDYSTQIDDVMRGHAELERICTEGNAAACRRLTDKRSPSYFYGSVFANDLEREVNRLCALGDMKACWVLFRISESIPPMGFEEYFRVTRDTCAEHPEFFACLAASNASRKIADIAFMQIEAEFCSAHNAEERKECCLKGERQACATLGRDTEDPVMRILGNTHRAGFMSYANRNKLSDPNALQDACDAGEMLACIAFAVQETVIPLGVPTSESDRAIWETHLKAPCEAGVEAACLAYAIRIIDVPVDEPRDMESARATLELACDRKNQTACWWLVLFFDDYEDHAMERAMPHCAISADEAACGLLEDLVLKDLGLHPWRVNRLVTLREYESECVNGDPLTCEKYHDVLEQMHDFPTVRRPYSAVKLACEKGFEYSCAWETYLGQQWGVDD